jgi:serine O-acetyltransferase
VGLTGLVRSDYDAYRLKLIYALIGVVSLHTFYVVLLYRVAHWLRVHHIPILPGILRGVGVALYGCDISPSALIGPGFRIAHSVGVVVGAGIVAGRNLQLFQSTSLGGRDRIVDGKEVVPGLVEVEVAVPRLTPALR